MKAVIFTLLIFAPTLCPQTLHAGCPEITVYGPAGVPKRGGEMLFSLLIKNEPPGQPLDFEWTSSVGKIVRGQGARQIAVTGWIYSDVATATVEIKGLPAGCPSRAFGETAFSHPSHPKPAGDEYTDLEWADEKVRLARFIDRLGAAERAAGVVTIEVADRQAVKSAIDRGRSIYRYLKSASTGYDGTIRVGVYTSGRSRTRLWTIPYGGQMLDCGPECLWLEEK